MDVEVLGLVFRRKALGFLPGRVAGDIGRRGGDKIRSDAGFKAQSPA